MSLTQLIEQLTEEREPVKAAPERIERFSDSIRENFKYDDRSLSADPQSILSTQFFHILLSGLEGLPSGGALESILLWRYFARNYDIYPQGLYDTIDYAVVPYGGDSNTQYSLAIISDKKSSLLQEPESVRLSTFFSSQLSRTYSLFESLYVWKRTEESRLSQLESNKINNDQIVRLRRFLLENITIEMISDFIFKVDPEVVVVPRDEQSLVSTPSPACEVSLSGKSQKGTVGALAINSNNKEGVTIARHTIGGTSTQSTIGMNVNIAGHPGVVISEDILSDSCFVEMNKNAMKNLGVTASSGPAKNIPRQFSDVYFDRVHSSSKISTKIQAWSPDILSASELNQVKVFTDNDLNPGDSGTALLDQDGFILGFAFSRAGLTDNPQFSSWMWADSVFQRHHLSAF